MRSKFLFMLLFAIAANVYAQNKFTLSLSGYYDVHNRTLSDDFYRHGFFVLNAGETEVLHYYH